ncbi:MAG TPA: hypothetical protein VFY53_06225, partial [Rhodoplanes sp.]|nr:hypothetical protein [Rhodoplanes sp.]
MIATGGPAFEASIMVLGDRGNRDPHRLLAGRRSAALLSLERGVPVVPVGIRFPRAEPNRPIRDHTSWRSISGRSCVLRRGQRHAFGVPRSTTGTPPS